MLIVLNIDIFGAVQNSLKRHIDIIQRIAAAIKHQHLCFDVGERKFGNNVALGKDHVVVVIHLKSPRVHNLKPMLNGDE